MRCCTPKLSSGAIFLALFAVGGDAAAQEFVYWFTDDFDAYANTTNFVGTNNNGWRGGWNAQPGNLRRSGTLGDPWSIVGGKLAPTTDTHCVEAYNQDDCAFGSSSYWGAVGTNPSGTLGQEPEDNWIVKSSPESLADPDFGMAFQFANVDDDGVGMIFRHQDHENFYLFEWAWKQGGGPQAGAHLYTSGLQGGHAVPICADAPPSSRPARCTSVATQSSPPGSPAVGAIFIVGASPTGAWVGQTGKEATWNGTSWQFAPAFKDRIIGRAQGNGGWLYRVRDGVPVQIASTGTSYIPGQVYNVMIRGIQRATPELCPGTPPASCPAGGCAEITVWMDRTNDGFQDSDKLIEFCDSSTSAIVTGGAYGVWHFDNSSFTVDGFIAQEAPLEPTINPASVTASADDLNGYLVLGATSNRNAAWTLQALDPPVGGGCNANGTVLAQTTTTGWTRTLDFSFPGLARGRSYCWKITATNSLGSSTVSATVPVALLPAISVTTPVTSATGSTTMSFAFSGSVAGTGTFDHAAGDCGGGGYSLRSGAAGALTYAQAWDRTALRLDSTHTVDAWVYVETAATGYRQVLGKGVDASHQINYALAVDEAGRVRYKVGDGTGSCTAVSSAGMVPVATWRHLAGRYNGTTLEVLVNGVVAGSTACSRVPYLGTSPFLVGADGIASFQGLVAHVGLHDAVISNATLAARAAAGAVQEQGTLTGTVLLWHLRDSPLMQSVQDGSVSAAHGFLGSSPRSDSNDADRLPSFGAGIAGGSATSSFSGTVGGLTANQPYCARGAMVAAGDARRAVSPLHLFQHLQDATPPTVAPNSTVQLECSGPGGVSYTLSEPGVSDNLDPAPTLDAYANSISVANLMPGPPHTYVFPYQAPGPLTTVLWQATDFAGNSATVNQNVWIADTVPPSLDAGPNQTVEATSPSGTPVALVPSAVDACDAAPAVSSNAPALFPLGTTTVNVLAQDDAGLTAVDSLTIQVVDTTPPLFVDDSDADPSQCDAVLPDLYLAFAGCYTGPLAPPMVTDNGYAGAGLSLFFTRNGSSETLHAASGETYCDVDPPVAVSWRVVDGAGNECVAAQNVIPGGGSFSTAYRGLSLSVDPLDASLVNDGRFHGGDVLVVYEVSGCAAGATVTFDPAPLASSDGVGDPSIHTATYADDGEYSVIATTHCSLATGLGDVRAVFGIDSVAPASDFSEVPSLGVVAGDASTYPRVFLGEVLGLDAFEGFDTTGPVQSGIASVSLALELADGTPEAVLGTLTPASSGAPLARGPASVGAGTAAPFSCGAAAGTVCGVGQVAADLLALSTLDGGQRRGHRLVITLTDVAGNSATESFYFLMRNWDDALDEGVLAAQALVDDPANAFALLELEDAQENVVIADSYAGLSPAYTDGSYLRAQYAVDFYESAESFGIDVGSQREYLARAAWGDVRLYSDSLVVTAPSDAALLSAADDELASGAEHRQSAEWGALVRDARGARDAVALLYPAYQPFRAKQRQAQTAFNTSGWPTLAHIDETQEMIGLARAFLNSSTKVEIIAALGDPGTTQQAALQAIVAAIDAVDPCLEDLETFNLDDLEYAQCYLAIDSMAATLATVQVSLVSTYRWQAAMALALFGMLEVSLNLSPTGIPWVIAGGTTSPVFTPRASWGALDADAGQSASEYSSAVLSLNAGDIATAYARFAANRCLLVTLYNRYFSTGHINSNVSGFNGYESPLDPSSYGCF